MYCRDEKLMKYGLHIHVALLEYEMLAESNVLTCNCFINYSAQGMLSSFSDLQVLVSTFAVLEALMDDLHNDSVGVLYELAVAFCEREMLTNLFLF